ncbi:stabilizer of axonemal microtubules 1 isoform X2 [Phlebotomus papatasi]|uniref:stabilizer of axonemal microtubules 1 isoform X2 n=1 Tax=Phlebotomus papatasi TaxID=29031 RepID=UPI0024846838|nr:stabilizer of axonemal microtubules 1 isoform X2 [Phlebotomus papatasi]
MCLKVYRDLFCGSVNHLSGEPFRGDTIYRKSYYGVSKDELLKCRPKANKPNAEIARAEGKMPSETIFTLSYQPNKINRRKPFIPKTRCHKSSEPLESLTTHMHDFVPKKLSCRPQKIIQMGNIERARDKFSGDTVNRLSYCDPIGAERVVSLRPKIDYCPPSEPMDNRTIQRLSYLPTKLPPRENFPWMKKDKHIPDSGPMAKDTIYRKSYFANPNFRPPKPIKPQDGNALFNLKSEPFNPSSIYQLSYYPEKIEKVQPIVPKPELEMERKKFEGSTIHSLSYIAHSVDARRRPIVPSQRKIQSNDPMEHITTQKRDFVPKFVPKVQPFRPKKSEMCLKTEYAPIDGWTINKLSFQQPPVDFWQKAPTPWVRPESSINCLKGKIAKDTIHSLSYQAPGQIVDSDDCCHCPKPLISSCSEEDDYPKAEV